MRYVYIVSWISTIAFIGLFTTSASGFQPSESATYVGSQACLGCHNATTGPALGTMDASGWQNTLHANLYRQPTTGTVIGNFKSAPVEFKVGNATLTVSFDDGGGSGPWKMRLRGATFDTTLTVARAHGGKDIAKNEDPVLPDTPGRRKWIGKQRYHAKIGNSYYILPAQWNPRPDRDGGALGWVPYHPEHWMGESGNYALSFRRSEELRCSGCHQVGPGPTVSAQGEYRLAKADDSAFWNIGCESCHGPGSEHVGQGGRGPIVNPKDLTVLQQNELCGACHNRVKGFQIGGNDTDYPYSATLNRTFRPGENLASFIARDAGGYWPDGTSRQHHQQYPDYQKSGHAGKLSCMSCHNSHNETNFEHDLVKTARDNSLCTQCHPSYSNPTAVAQHTKHSVDLARGLGRCVDCHMAAVQKSGVNYDIHSHTFKVISPQVTIDTQADGGQPNSCAVSCHGDGLLGAPTFGFAGKLGTWNEEVDVKLAQRLLQPIVPNNTPATPIHRAVVVATLTRNGVAVSGATVAFSHSTSGRSTSFDWSGTTNAQGRVTIEIVVDSRLFRNGASGYYLARATNASGASVGSWNSIPLNGGIEQAVTLPVGGRAVVESVKALTFALLGNSPNPFNPETHIGYSTPESGDVRMVIYNSIGQQVRVLVNEYQTAGEYTVRWDGKDEVGHQVASGIYFYKLASGSHVATRRMVMLK
ncbi:MAG: T9SS type A sorting domain-containing protein [bacterium]|nr:T9SS type A sorting domain-containing protein [bacterium]